VSGFADGRGQAKKQDAKNAFQAIVESLATCVYDLADLEEGQTITDGDVLAYNDPITNTVGTIPHVASCTGEGAPGDGWGQAAGKVFVCGNACTSYRTTLKNASYVNALFGKPAPAMPIFAHKAACAPKPKAP